MKIVKWMLEVLAAVVVMGIMGIGLVYAQESDVPEYTASPSATISPKPLVTPNPGDPIACKGIRMEASNAIAPAEITFRVNPVEVEAQGYRYHFGDGVLREFGSDGQEYTHTYYQPRSYRMWVEVKNTEGRWLTDKFCEKKVEILPNQQDSREVRCVGLEVNDTPSGFDRGEFETGEVLKFAVIGQDNKNQLESFRLNLDGDKVIEQAGSVFLHRYIEAGTYQVSAAVKAKGQVDWVEGVSECMTEITVGGSESDVTPVPTIYTDESTNTQDAYGVEQDSGVSNGVIILAVVIMGVGIGMLVWSMRKVK